MREVEEETGLRCSLGRELKSTSYLDAKKRPKSVRYWLMEIVDGTLRFDHEVDDARWLTADEAAATLTYARDVDVLCGAGQEGRGSRCAGRRRARSSWSSTISSPTGTRMSSGRDVPARWTSRSRTWNRPTTPPSSSPAAVHRSSSGSIRTWRASWSTSSPSMKPVGTLCLGPQVPAALGLLRGRRSSAFGPLAPDIEMAGGGVHRRAQRSSTGTWSRAAGRGHLAEWPRALLEVLDRSGRRRVAHRGPSSCWR